MQPITRDWSIFSAASASTRALSSCSLHFWHGGQAVHCISSPVSGCWHGNPTKSFSNYHRQCRQYVTSAVAWVSASWRRRPPSDGLKFKEVRGLFYLPRASLFHPPSSPSPCIHLPLDFQERRTSLGYRPRGDWRHRRSYRTQWLRQWPGPAWTRWRTCNLFLPLCRTCSCSRWRAFWVKLHLSRRSVPLSRQTWAKTHCGSPVPLTTERPSELGLRPGQSEQGRAPGHGADQVICPLLSAETDGLGVVAVVHSTLVTPLTDRAHSHLPCGIIPALWLEAGAPCHLVATGPVRAPRPLSADATCHHLRIGFQLSPPIQQVFHPQLWKCPTISCRESSSCSGLLLPRGRLTRWRLCWTYSIFQRINSTIMKAQLMSHDSAMTPIELFTHLHMLRPRTVFESAGVDLPQRDKDRLIVMSVGDNDLFGPHAHKVVEWKKDPATESAMPWLNRLKLVESFLVLHLLPDLPGPWLISLL